MGQRQHLTLGPFTVREIALLAGLGDGFSIGEMHSFVDVHGIGIADMGYEGHKEGQEEDQADVGAGL